MGLFSIGGKKKKDATAISCLVIGEDKNVMHRTLQSTGAFLLDSKNLLAYDSFPECIGSCVRAAKGKRKYLGLTSALYENMARPFSFKTLDWIQVMHKEDQIKEGALSEGYSKAVQGMDLRDRFDRMTTILTLAVAGVIGMAFILAIQRGLFSKLFGG